MKSKIILLLTLMLSLGISTKAQVYTCEQLQEDIKSWNKLKNSNNTKWALAIRDKGMYKTNADGSFEYVYILQTTDSVNIPTLSTLTIQQERILRLIVQRME